MACWLIVMQWLFITLIPYSISLTLGLKLGVQCTCTLVLFFLLAPSDTLAYWNSWTLDASVGCWTLGAGLWTQDAGLSTLDAAIVSEQNQNPVSDSAWLNYWKYFGWKSLRNSWSHLFCRDYKFWLGYF